MPNQPFSLHVSARFIIAVFVAGSSILACQGNCNNACAQQPETLTLEQFRGYKQEAIGSGWQSTDGEIQFDGSGGGDIITKETYKNFELNLEWKISEGGNSGIMYRVGLGDGAPYLTGPEYQILDDAKHADGKNEMTSAGSLYAMYKPTNKKLMPVGQWNKTKIVVNGNHVEHWLNDSKVVDVEWGSDDWKERLGKSKFASWEKFATLAEGHIALQDHGDPVAYRNISVRKLPDSVDLLAGSTLDQFRGFHQEEIGKGWKLTDGVLEFDGSGGGDIMTKQTFMDFDLTFDWKVTEGANSGVMYRVATGENAPYFTGPEFQVLDDDKHADGKNPLTSAGSLYALYAPADKQLKPVGQWNSSRIVLNKNHVEHWLNGQKVVDTELHSDDWNNRVGNSKFKDWKKFGTMNSGHICFQDHGDPVAFRNIVVVELPGE